jgi:IS30 family transposase
MRRAAVNDRVKECWPPEQMAGGLGFDGKLVRIGHEPMYADVYSREGSPDALAWHQRSRRKERKQQHQSPLLAIDGPVDERDGNPSPAGTSFG